MKKLHFLAKTNFSFSEKIFFFFIRGWNASCVGKRTAYTKGYFQPPDGYALTRHNVLSKVYAGACAVLVVRAMDTRLLPVSHRVSTLRFPSVFLPTLELNTFVFHRLCFIAIFQSNNHVLFLRR